jgi:putative oxidoreductase
MGFGLLLLRVVLGLTLAAHGAQKLFGWFGGYGLDATGGFLESIGFRPGRRNALMAGLTEAGGGVLLALGLLTPAAAALVLSVMIVAGASVHAGKGFFASNGGYEYTFVLGLAALSIAFTGPGAWSLDSALGLQLNGWVWGFAALTVGVVGSLVQLASRRPAPAAATR